jgi:hypothetical protein
MIKKKCILIQNTPSSFIQCIEAFKKVCQFFNEDIVMKFWVVGMNQTREMLRSLNLHLTKKHEVARKKRVRLSVGNLPLKKLSLERYSVNIGGYSFTDVFVLFVARSLI